MDNLPTPFSSHMPGPVLASNAWPTNQLSMPKNSLSKFAVSSGQEVIIQDERRGYDHHSNFVHLEYIGYNDNNKSKESDKFWQGWTEGRLFCYRFGKRGTKGVTKSSAPWSDEQHALHALNTKVREKRRDGYKTARA